MDDDKPSVEIYKRVNEPGKLKFVLTKLSISDSVEEVFQQTLHAGVTRLLNPLWRLINWITGLNPAFTQLE